MTTSTGPGYRDRKTGLVVLGVLEIAIGLFCGLAVLLVLFGRALAAARATPPPPQPTLLSMVVMYASAATAFVWLGCGSIFARRWARAMILCLSGIGLVGGATACVSMAFILPHLFDRMAHLRQPGFQTPSALLAVEIITGAFAVVIYIILPGTLFLFYRSRHVKRTCEVCDPVERWTDRCPLPVLAYSIMMVIAVVMSGCLVAQGTTFPIFGQFFTGSARILIGLLVGGVSLYLAWALYGLAVRAWWLALALVLIGTASNLVTFWNADPADLYAKMGFNLRTDAASAQLLIGSYLNRFAVLSVLPWLAWLLWIRRYFIRPPVPPVLGPVRSSGNF